MTDVRAAINLAWFAHATQTRRDGSPYIYHPLRVMAAVSRYTTDPDILAAAVLHDVLEDTHMPESSLLVVSPAAHDLVLELTHVEGDSYDVYIDAITDPRAMLIKLADLADNGANRDDAPARYRAARRTIWPKFHATELGKRIFADTNLEGLAWL